MYFERLHKLCIKCTHSMYTHAYNTCITGGYTLWIISIWHGVYATATRPIPKRRPLYATATTQILNLSNLLKGSDIKTQEDLEENRAAKRQRYQEDVEENRAAKRQRYQEDVEETALLKGRNTRTIQLPLRHLKGIGIGMIPLSDWLNVLPRGSGIAGVTELPLRHYYPKVVSFPDPHTQQRMDYITAT